MILNSTIHYTSTIQRFVENKIVTRKARTEQSNKTQEQYLVTGFTQPPNNWKLSLETFTLLTQLRTKLVS